MKNNPIFTPTHTIIPFHSRRFRHRENRCPVPIKVSQTGHSRKHFEPQYHTRIPCHHSVTFLPLTQFPATSLAARRRTPSTQLRLTLYFKKFRPDASSRRDSNSATFSSFFIIPRSLLWGQWKRFCEEEDSLIKYQVFFVSRGSSRVLCVSVSSFLFFCRSCWSWDLVPARFISKFLSVDLFRTWDYYGLVIVCGTEIIRKTFI